MSESSSERSINESLDIIRKALQEESLIDNTEDILILNNLVKNDGTITPVSHKSLKKQDIDIILKEKLSELFDKHFENWLNNNIPDYLDKYFSKKKNN